MHRRQAPLARTSLAAAAALALVAPLAACSNAEGGADTPGDAAGEARTALVYATGDAEPACLDPHVSGNYPQGLLGTQVFDSLVSRDESGEIIPWLATEWQQGDDGLSWDFTLDPEARFSDGTPVDAEAVRANIEHLQDPETGSSTGYLAMRKVESVEAVDANRVRFHLSEPDAALLESLSQVWVAMQSPAGFARGKEENCLSPIGSGPFVIDEWVKQDRIELTRNPDYTTPPEGTELPSDDAAETLTWRFILDATARFAALEAGQVDVIDNPLPEQVLRAEQEGSGLVHLDAPRAGASNRIELNTAQAPFDDQRVREAFIASANVDAALASLYEGVADRSFSPLSSMEPLSLQLPDAYAYDPERADELLDEAGWSERDDDGIRVKDGERLTARFPVNTSQSVQAEQALFEQVQAGAAAVGIEVQLQPMDQSSWYAALAAHDYELVSAPYTKVGPDVLRFLFHTDFITPAPSGYFPNATQISDPELDELLEVVGDVSDPVQREQAAHDAQRRVAELQLILPVYDQQNRFIHRDDVTGIFAMPTVATPFLGGAVAGGTR